jgi:hypothetical protein
MRVSDRLSAPERERIVPGDSELACLIRDFDESQTDLEAPQYWPENLRLAGKKGVRDLVMERCCALHNFRVCLRPWASDGLIGINSIGQHDKRPRAIPCRAVFVVQRVSYANNFRPITSRACVSHSCVASSDTRSRTDPVSSKDPGTSHTR